MDIPNLNLPDDLPENWTLDQTVSPNGTEVGLTKQHGYNYLNAAVNLLKAAIQTVQNLFSGVAPIDNPVFTGSISLGRRPETLIGDLSVAEGSNTAASGAYTHAEGNYTVASGVYSHAEGERTIASDQCSHAEGYSTEATSMAAHAEGGSTLASGSASHAEGSRTKAVALSSHAEGSHTETTGTASHAEGTLTTASGSASHAEGGRTISSGDYSHAEGYFTTAENFACHTGGKYNAPLSASGNEYNTTGDAFVIGIGVVDGGPIKRKNGFRVTCAGQVFGTGSYNTSGADYAEYFEWADGNPQKQDRVGYFVTLDGDKISLAKPGDFVLGIVSGNPCIIGNSDETWLGFYLYDDFGRFIREYLEAKTVEVTPSESVDDIERWKLENQVEEKDGKYYRTVVEVVDHETPSWRLKVNPEYDPEKGYTSRADRPEWDAIGMLGVLTVRDDGTCKVNGFAKAAEGGTATAAEGYMPGQTYRVIARVNENAVKVIFR